MARICDRAERGQRLSSAVLQELAAGKLFLFTDRSERIRRAVEDPVRPVRGAVA